MNTCKKVLLFTVVSAVLTAPQLHADDTGDTEMDVYGHIMLDMGYQSGASDANWYDVVRPTKLPVYENEYGEDGNFFASVRQTRLGVKTTTPIGDDEVKTIFEFELFGVGPDEGQTTFRLRHAYAEYGEIGAGQYWSAFMDPDVFPNSIEYWGPNGMVFFRNIQLRYTPITGENHFAIALEKPGGSGDPGVRVDEPLAADLQGRFPLPDVTAQYRRTGDWGHYQVAGILRYAEIDDLNPTPVDESDSVLGWGLNLSSNIRFDRDVLRLQLVFGEAIQNYMNDGSVDTGATGTGSSDFVEELPIVGLVAFYDITWSDKYSSSIGYSMVDIDNSDGQTAAAFRRGQYALANLLHHPNQKITWGGELQWAKRENKGDGKVDAVTERIVESSDDLRLQLSFKYYFGKTIGGKV